MTGITAGTTAVDEKRKIFPFLQDIVKEGTELKVKLTLGFVKEGTELVAKFTTSGGAILSE